MKLRKIANLVRGKKVSDALAILKTMPHKGAKMTYKVIHAARANFHVMNPEENLSGLVITTITVDQGPTFRRMMPRARGRADVIRKGLAHMTAYVSLKEAGDIVQTAKPEVKEADAPKAPAKKAPAKKTATKKTAEKSAEK